MITKILQSKWIAGYYKIQAYIDIGWGEVSWFSNSLIELMAIVFFLEKLGLVIVGSTATFILIGAFLASFLFGLLLKKLGIYDKSIYVITDIDPVEKKLFEAANLIIKHYKKQTE